MTFKLIQDIKNAIAATMPDNTTGQITPAILRNVLLDMCDSLFSRAGALYGALGVAGVAQSITTVPTNFPVLMPNAINNNPTLLTVNAITGLITALVGGFGVTLSYNVVWMSATNNVELDAAVYKNGVVYARGKMGQNGATQNKQNTGGFSVLVAGVAANDIFELRLSSPQGPTSITFYSMDFTVSINPTLTSL